jgi:hypothetical protein
MNLRSVATIATVVRFAAKSKALQTVAIIEETDMAFDSLNQR